MRKIKILILLIAALTTTPALVSGQKSISDQSWKSVATDMPDEWYGSKESLKIAENVLLYQRAIGGWPKNIPMHHPLTEAEKAKIIEEKGLNDAIFDNGSTTMEMEFLAKIFSDAKNNAYKESFNRGLKFILEAQYKNGGWPMFYPLQEGYYTHITFNDDAMVNILELLRDIAEKKPLYKSIVSADASEQCRNAFNKGIECILKTQIIVNGKPTIWCAQHDENTLLPAKGRSYELPSFSGAESGNIIKLLMKIPEPSPAIIKSVQGAIEWLNAHKLRNTRWEMFKNSDGLVDRRIITDKKAGDMWARFYDLETGEPFVCDRDGIKKKTLEEIGYERRNGYSWYTDKPQEAIDKYAAWEKKWIKR